MSIVVTNKGEHPHRGRFDGKSYEFPVDEPVSIPDAAAAYLFAFGKTDADRAKLLVKNGWQKNGNPGDPYGPEAARARLNSFVFQVVKEEDVVRAARPKATVEGRQKTGVNAMSSLVDERGNRTAPASGGPMQLPGSSAPIAPAA